MKKLVLNFLIVTALAVLTSCNEDFDNPMEFPGIRNKFLVDKIYDYNNNLITEYLYDKNNRLVKSIYTNKLLHPIQTVDMKGTTEFIYNNGRVSKVVDKTRQHYFYPETGHEYTYNFDSETTFEYDSRGKLVKENGQDLNLNYENGRVVSIGDNIEPYTNTIVYDDSENIIEHINILPELNMLGQPIPGTTQRVVLSYEYDNNPKPNFGLDYLFTYQPIPGMGSETGYVGGLSQNNMTKYVNSGTTWTYTYNEHGLPETIETKWNGVETLEPMLLRITYKTK
jgi:hypothetical protein